ncbi:MAG TPA: ABC transporter, partial [Pseudolabrys sp.]|nr:ABC transporter [Pseudolabrys sp.]
MNVRIITFAIAVAALATLPFWVSGVYYINVSSQILFYAVFALGLNVLVGYAGLVSLGHAGLFGISAYATAYLLAAGAGHTVAIIAGLLVGIASMAAFAALSL